MEKERLPILVKTYYNHYNNNTMSQEKNKVFVVTRNFRRVEDKNYTTKEEAEVRSKILVNVLKKWKDPDSKKVRVIESAEPYKIK